MYQHPTVITFTSVLETALNLTNHWRFGVWNDMGTSILRIYARNAMTRPAHHVVLVPSYQYDYYYYS
jgi:hypothetical protein